MKEGGIIKNNLIMLDYDGVIVDSKNAFTATFLGACRICGYTGIKTPEQVVRLFDGNFFEALIHLGLSSEKIDEILGDAFEREAQKHIAKVRPFPGIQASLKAMSRQNVLTVITSNVSRLVRQVFEKEGIACFAEVVGGEAERSKVKKIQNTMARYRDLPAYYVGDTKGDMLEGKKAGAVTVAVTWGWHTADNLAEASPDHMVNTLSALENLLS
jgi:phosphoglycolate phosphatase